MLVAIDEVVWVWFWFRRIHVLPPWFQAKWLAIAFSSSVDFPDRGSAWKKIVAYMVRFKQETGISSPSLYPSPSLPLLLPATVPAGNRVPARENRATVVDNRDIERVEDMLANSRAVVV